MQIGVMFGNPETTPGGKALKFYTSVRIDIRSAGMVLYRKSSDDEKPIFLLLNYDEGHWGFVKGHVEDGESKEVDVTDKEFRYPGPKPQTPEAAALMLADSCEAAIRSLEKPTPSKVEKLFSKKEK